MSRLPYRRDLDGLRAVAVLLVVAYHFGVPGIGGGYIGVDLFFVISGFLIASILETEPRITPAVLAGFYARRIKRLAPAFIVVALCTTAAATWLLLPDDYLAFLRSVRESFLFRANVFFERATTGYFAASAAELPWLHTWSLSVEWQFYLVFPLVAWLLRRLPDGRTRTLGLAAAVVAAIALSVAMTGDRPTHAYFSAAARFFEFLLGALAVRVAPRALGVRTALGISAACVAALLVLSVVFTRETSFPGANAFAVGALGFTLIVTGRTASVLAFDAAAFIGRRSYAAYLWHWPIVASLAYVQHVPTGPGIVLWVVVVFVLSDLTYRLVERPGLALRWRLPVAFGCFCVVPLALFAAFAFVARSHDGWPARLGAEAMHAETNLRAFPATVPERCHDQAADDPESCAFGDTSSARTALLIGDSHARHFEPFIGLLATNARVKVFASTASECLALEGVAMPSLFATHAACEVAVARAYRRIREERFAFVVIAERWIGYPADQLDRLDASLRAIEATGAIPVLFAPAAEDGSNPKDCFYRPIKLRRPVVEHCTIATDAPFAVESRRRVEALIASMKARHPTLRLVDSRSVQCERGVCATVIDDTPIYGDTHHLNAFGSTMLGRAYLARFGNPLVP